MALEYPLFLINYKVYDGTAGDDGLALAEMVEAVQRSVGGTFAIAPQTPDLTWFARDCSVPVVAQSVDATAAGRGNGRVSLQAVASGGVEGVILNHPESRDTFSDVASLVDDCTEFGLESIVCVDSVKMGGAALAFDPDCLLFEEPGDIATGESMVQTHPELVEEFVTMVREDSPTTRVLLGGGIADAEDVARALGLGADAAGAASAFVEADERWEWLSSIAEVLAESET